MTYIHCVRCRCNRLGFVDLQTLPFPQPIYPSGLWSVTLARKSEAFNGFREDDADTLSQSTEYYNAGIHHGALATPNYMKRAFEKK